MHHISTATSASTQTTICKLETVFTLESARICLPCFIISKDDAKIENEANCKRNRRFKSEVKACETQKTIVRSITVLWPKCDTWSPRDTFGFVLLPPKSTNPKVSQGDHVFATSGLAFEFKHDSWLESCGWRLLRLIHHELHRKHPQWPPSSARPPSHNGNSHRNDRGAARPQNHPMIAWWINLNCTIYQPIVSKHQEVELGRN